MAYGIAEDPARSINPHLDAADYPATREDLVQLAEEDGAPVEVINVFKALPKDEYGSKEAVLRDLAEAFRRAAVGPSYRDDEERDRSNLAKDRVEDNPGAAGRHP